MSMRRILVVAVVSIIILLYVLCQIVVPRASKEKEFTNVFIGPDWHIQIIYQSGGQSQRTESMVPSVLVGLEARKLAELCPYWQLKTVGSNRITVEVNLDHVLGEYAGCRFIGIWGDNVAVFAGIPNVRQVPLEFAPVRIQDLPDYELANLARGIGFDSTEEKLQFLESLREYRSAR
jgi:hypothetical protein